MEALRQLPQERAQLPRLDQRCQPLHQAPAPVGCPLQPPDVRQVTARLDREEEAVGRLIDPALHGLDRGQPVESGVHLDRVEMLGVVLEPETRRASLVERLLPVPVVPAATADSNRLQVALLVPRTAPE